MSKTTLALLLSAGVVALSVGNAYYANVYRLRFSLADVKVTQGGNIGLVIAVTNPSGVFGYPVPQLRFNIFDQAGAFLGTMVNHQLQWIAAGNVSYIYAWVEPNYLQCLHSRKQLFY
jgi:hypothetical protein